MYHQKEFKKFCRVCGERISRNRVSFSCQQLADNIAQTFGVFCGDDCPDVHATGALASHCDQRQQQRRVNNTTTVSRHSLGPVIPQINAPFVIVLRKSAQEDDQNNLVRMNCLCTALEERGGLLCPCCSGDHLKDFSTMVHPTSVVMTVLGNHTVSCSLCKKSIASGSV